MESIRSARARAYANIAFIKYWGNRDARLRLPSNPSLSMNLGALHTTTTVTWSPDLTRDQLRINGVTATEAATQRASQHLELLRRELNVRQFANVRSRNNFPMGAGIASSASAFAALTLAAVCAAGVDLPSRDLSRLSRRGSGSAARSIPGGFVEWHAGTDDSDSIAESIAGPEHWALVDVIAILSRAHKQVGSTAGHALAGGSILQTARVESAGDRLTRAKAAILKRDFAELASVVEADSNLMHAVMMTSQPPLFYWLPDSLKVMLAVREWRERDGLRVCYTLDAGPNVHCVCEAEDAAEVADRIKALVEGVDVVMSHVGGGAHVLESPA